ncbi:molecular chaperone HtpG [Apibacter mensalis]|uniref:Molecular chaperone HtpG n=1 Tax=Apibacter mensalis TaxID=1586267 RepID=A0A0X3ALC3_9FLAO|nr:HSP90 family protein [Apibacter mensalis]CVK15191.1 molecular chaperone HtpG [Apibacter mensalis]
MEDKNKYVFQVNLKGMIELLSEHIYSAPNIFIRELLQNGIDAVTARKNIDELEGEITVYLTTQKNQLKLIFEDNGIGLTEEEVHQFLSVIGQSSKRGDIDEKDFIGKFGIGMLSCLVVSDEIIVETRSLIKNKGICWRGKADGTYTVEATENIEKAGTRVILTPKKEWRSLFKEEEIKKNILYFGDALPIQINLITDKGSEILVNKEPVWLRPEASKKEILEYGRKVFGINFLDSFKLESNAGDVKGIAYIMPYKVQFTGNTKQNKIYLKRMFLCEEAKGLLPEWSTFVRCVVNTNSLRPTASRESLMNDKLMVDAKNELTLCFKDYLKYLTVTDTEILSQIIKIHHLYIKALAVEDTELLKIFVDFIPFETNKGMMNFLSLRTYNDIIYYTPSLDDFRQIRRIAGSQGKTIINSAYSFETDLIEKIKLTIPDVTFKKITPQDILDNFGEVKISDNQYYKRFEEKTNQLLQGFYCKAQLKEFSPIDTPAIYVANDEAMNNKNIQSLSNLTNPFSSTLPNFVKKENENLPTLCFNKDNEIVQKLFQVEDSFMFEAIVHIMYVQALMLGGYPVNKKEMEVFNNALYQLMILGMSDFI